MAKLTLIRHGQSYTNAGIKRCSNDMNFLTLKGIECTIAKAVDHRESYADLHYDAVLVSPFPRAQQTALTFMSAFGNKPVALQTCPQFQERDYGFNDYIPMKELQAQFGLEGVRAWDETLDQGPPNGETQQDVYNRAIAAFEQHVVSALAEGKNVAVVSHFYVLRALYSFMETRTPISMSKFQPQNSIPVLFNDDEVQAVLRFYNNTKMAA